MRIELVIRFDYGSIVPVGPADRRRHLRAVAGPDALVLRTPVAHRGEDLRTRRPSSWCAAGERVPFMLTWYPSHEPPPRAVDAGARARRDRRVLARLVGPLHVRGRWREAVMRSLITLKALTYAPTGGIVAARDDVAAREARRRAQLGLPLLLAARRDVHAATRCCSAGYIEEARAWRDWLLRAVAGDPPSCRSCTAWPASGGCPSSSSTGCPATRARSRSASATPPPSSSSSTSTARCWTRCTRPRQTGLRDVDGGRGRSQRQLLELPRRRVARARRGHLGGARPAPALHALEGDGLGRVRPRRAGGRALRTRRTGRPLAARSAPRSTTRSASEGFDAELQLVHPVVRRRSGSTRAC